MSRSIGLPRIGVAVILRRGPSILVGCRKGSHGAGTWSFPGGHLEPGEDIEECAAREPREETGIGCRSWQFRKVAFTQDRFPERKHYLTLFLEGDERLAQQDPELLEPDKCSRWIWVHRPPAPLFLPIVNLMREQPGLLWSET